MTDSKNKNDINYDKYDTIFDSEFWYGWRKYVIFLFIVIGAYTVLRIIWLLFIIFRVD